MARCDWSRRWSGKSPGLGFHGDEQAQEGRVPRREARADPQDLPRVAGRLQPQGGREARLQGRRRAADHQGRQPGAARRQPRRHGQDRRRQLLLVLPEQGRAAAQAQARGPRGAARRPPRQAHARPVVGREAQESPDAVRRPGRASRQAQRAQEPSRRDAKEDCAAPGERPGPLEEARCQGQDGQGRRRPLDRQCVQLEVVGHQEEFVLVGRGREMAGHPRRL